MPEQAGRFNYGGLDRAIHEKARLGILTSLIGHPKGLAFADLKRLCDLTDGNLNRHLQVLQEAELVTLAKPGDRRPVTTCTLTARGRAKFIEYLDVLEAVVRDAREEASPHPAQRLSRA